MVIVEKKGKLMMHVYLFFLSGDELKVWLSLKRKPIKLK